MRLSRYGIVLETMRADHLEMVRLWRNQDYIRQKMQFKQVLSRTDQERWFTGLMPEKNLYWIIRCRQYPIGLVHIKDIDADAESGEAGIFIGEPSFLEMPQAMLAILFMMELGFMAFGLKLLKAKIHSENHKAIRFNLDLGYVLEPAQPEGFQYYSVSRTAFETATASLRSRSGRMYGNETGIADLGSGSNWDEKLKMLSGKELDYLKPKFE